jgi:hypothetical protein
MELVRAGGSIAGLIGFSLVLSTTSVAHEWRGFLCLLRLLLAWTPNQSSSTCSTYYQLAGPLVDGGHFPIFAEYREPLSCQRPNPGRLADAAHLLIPRK